MHLTVSREGDFYVCNVRDENGTRTVRTTSRESAATWLAGVINCRIVSLDSELLELRSIRPDWKASELVSAADKEFSERGAT